MTSEDPVSRPNIQEALAQFEKILEELPEEEVQKEIFPLPVCSSTKYASASRKGCQFEDQSCRKANSVCFR